MNKYMDEMDRLKLKSAADEEVAYSETVAHRRKSVNAMRIMEVELKKFVVPFNSQQRKNKTHRHIKISSFIDDDVEKKDNFFSTFIHLIFEKKRTVKDLWVEYENGKYSICGEAGDYNDGVILSDTNPEKIVLVVVKEASRDSIWNRLD